MKLSGVIVLTALFAIISAASASEGKWFDRVMIVFFENAYYTTVLRNSIFSKTASLGSLLTNYKAITHPSQPNYLATISGSFWKKNTDSSVSVSNTTIVDLLEAKGLSWRSYQEDFPGDCFKKDRYPYVRKHNPFMTFENIRESASRCANIVNADNLWKDVSEKNLPDYMFYTPNMRNDGHDTGITGASKFLDKFINQIQTSGFLTQGRNLIVLTFDEDDYQHTNQVYTVLLGSMIKPGTKDNNAYDHYSILKTVQSNWDLPSLGRNDETATTFKF
ncbi:acid phosphatase [Acrasis kona]|uniref:Acid phosphatase n=1 Tax=Acrasis kona TaxID=1008807 RepID=A0AAW2ZMN7_9EUKA